MPRSETERIAGIAFVLIAAYLAVQAGRALAEGAAHSASGFGIAESVASLLVLPALGIVKLRVAGELRSRALRADGLLTLFGASLAGVTCTALVLERLEGWWWTDAAGALVIAALLLAEAIRTLVTYSRTGRMRLGTLLSQTQRERAEQRESLKPDKAGKTSPEPFSIKEGVTTRRGGI